MFTIKEQYEKCWHCENFYGPCFGEPLCMTCHLFLYPSTKDEEVGTKLGPNSTRSSLLVADSDNFINSDSTPDSNPNATATSSGLSQIRNLIEKLELNDSGNEDSDSEPQNLETYFENEATRNLPASPNGRPTYSMSNLSNEENGAGEGDNNNNDSSDAAETRTTPRKRRRRSLNNNSTNGESLAAYYPIQYSRRQLDSLARNPGRINLNRNNNNKRASGATMSASSGLSPSLKRRDALKEKLISLSSYDSIIRCDPAVDIINILPTEVLWNIFKKLDDLSLWSVSRVCKRWHELVSQELDEDKWKQFIAERWVFFRPAVRVKSYQNLYSQLVQSSNCLYCLQYIHSRPSSNCNDDVKKSWRHKRLLLELKALHQDPMPGINARPLDASCFYWQASITGPVGSPYEGGVFYLFLKIPPSYPLNPPLVQFITKIYHPNISKHGDIGLDSIHENWSLALTISKVLISIQSLLTDPYTKVCMEKDIGRLYMSNREAYERNARYFTWKYAMSDYIQFDDYGQFNYLCEQTRAEIATVTLNG